MPDNLKNKDNSKTRTFTVVRVHEGKAELLPDMDESTDTITIETDRFSIYAVAYQDTPKEDDNPGGGDNPGTGDNPGGGDNPGTGDNPGGGDNPGTGDNPGGGDNPGTGDNPGSGDNPGTGDTPGGGDNPATGDTPGSGDNSGIGGNSGNNGNGGDSNGNNNGSTNNDSNNNNNNNGPNQKDSEPKTGDAAPLELYATLAMIAGFAYLLLYFTDRKRGMTEETKKEFVSRLVGWAKRGGRLRKCLALAAIFILLVYYHGMRKLYGTGKLYGTEKLYRGIGRKTCVELQEIQGK